jgi:L-amino acid N-acyltransferase YncA
MTIKAPDGIHAAIHPQLFPIGCVLPTVTAIKQIKEAENWLKAKGCRIAYGPMYPYTWYPYRACLGPFDRSFFWGEPSFTAELWEQSGYGVVSRYTSTLCPNIPEIERHQAERANLEQKGWLFPSLKEKDVSLVTIHALTEQSFRQAFAYTPLSLNEFLAMYSPILQRSDLDLIIFAVSPDGKVMGFCFAIPDIENPELKQFIVKTLAVHPDARREGIGGSLVGEVHRRAHEKGWVNGGIHAMMWEGSLSQKITAHEGQLFRRYALFAKDL